MPEPELHSSFTVSDVFNCSHISRVTSDQIWVNDIENDLILTNSKGEELNHLQDFSKDKFAGGIHTVDSANDMIYIDRNYDLNVNKYENTHHIFKQEMLYMETMLPVLVQMHCNSTGWDAYK